MESIMEKNIHNTQKKHVNNIEELWKNILKKQWTTIKQIGHPFLTHEKIYGIPVTSRSDSYHPHGQISFKDNDCFPGID